MNDRQAQSSGTEMLGVSTVYWAEFAAGTGCKQSFRQMADSDAAHWVTSPTSS